MRKLITLLVIWQTLNVSAYCETGNRTASGVWPQVGMAAADHLPFGSRVTLPDGRVLTVTDRFGGNYTDRLDIFMDCEDACWKFGRKWMLCRIEVAK
jgi:3D (Asp-Asp-Asp) domain-containing protein